VVQVQVLVQEGMKMIKKGTFIVKLIIIVFLFCGFLFLYFLISSNKSDIRSINSKLDQFNPKLYPIIPAVKSNINVKIQPVFYQVNGVTDARPEISAIFDEKNVLHIVYKTTKFELAYVKFDNGKWSKPEVICNETLSAFNLLSDKDGKLYLIWSDDREAHEWVYYSINNGSGWSKPEPLIQGCNASPAIDGHKNIHLAFEKQGRDYTGIYYTRLTSNGWEKPVMTLTKTCGDTYYVKFTLASGNKDLFAIWPNWRIDQDRNRKKFDFYTRTNVSGTWKAAECFLENINYDHRPAYSVAIDNNEMVHLVWNERMGDYSCSMVLYSRFASGLFSMPEYLPNGPEDKGFYPKITCLNNNVHVIWQELNDKALQFAHRALVGDKWSNVSYVPSGISSKYIAVYALITSQDKLHIIYEDKGCLKHIVLDLLINKN